MCEAAGETQEVSRDGETGDGASGVGGEFLMTGSERGRG